jgi:DNA invertase Pin-like site-specific DNA recombinase
VAEAYSRKRSDAKIRRPVTEFVDHGVSGAKERRPQLDALLAAVRRRKFDLVLVTKLDRLARSTHHLVTLAGELEALGVDLVALDQAIDTTTPSGRLLFHMLAAIAEFERDLIVDRVRAGLARARAQGKRLGRPRIHHVDVTRAAELRAQGHSWRVTARLLGVHPMAAAAGTGDRVRTTFTGPLTLPLGAGCRLPSWSATDCSSARSPRKAV